jgi:uncharacterized protein (TIGR00730 family)
MQVSRKVKNMTPQKRQKPVKAYKDLDFLSSPDARTLRVLAEFLEPEARFKKHRIHDTIVFFGSARIKDPEIARGDLRTLTAGSSGRKRTTRLKKEILAAQSAVKMSRYYKDAMELSSLLTDWSLSLGRGKRRFIVCSGGGPGIMEAANRGATTNSKGYSIGLNISIPFEQFTNSYITTDLDFEFHYFFIRKYWFLYLAKALVAFPGGFGTFDELFEVLTLIQTKKVKKKLPVVIYGKSYWKKAINFDVLAEEGMIDAQDLDLIHFSDDPKDAFEYLRETLTANYLTPAAKTGKKKKMRKKTG